ACPGHRLGLPQDAHFQLPQRLTRLEAELVPQPCCASTVRRERLGLAPRAVQGEHEALQQLLAERMLGDKRFQLRNKLAVMSQRKLCVDPVLESHEPSLLQTRGRSLGPRLEAQVGERMAPPERERLLQRRRRLRRRRPRRRDYELLEAVGVDLAGSDDKLIAAV